MTNREIPLGYSPVPAGHLATVVTYLEMTAPPAPRVAPAPALIVALSLQRLHGDDLPRYRALFRAVGEPWLWFSRLLLDDAGLTAIIADPQVEAYAVMRDNESVGLLELDFREGDACELAFFGLISNMVRQGAGRWLMNEAITRAWSRPITRFHVHTCSLDHPDAVAFYVRSGFTPIARAVEVAPDPRLSGHLSPTAGAHAPLIAG